MPLGPISSPLLAVLRGRKAVEECKNPSPDLRSVMVLKCWVRHVQGEGQLSHYPIQNRGQVADGALLRALLRAS